jgi:hypothetical protein
MAFADAGVLAKPSNSQPYARFILVYQVYGCRLKSCAHQ